DILRAAAKQSRELDIALSTWGDITFTYESTDTPDVVDTDGFILRGGPDVSGPGRDHREAL
ncbi:hypothetical protein, partial [Actinomadura geliboluensis]